MKSFEILKNEVVLRTANCQTKTNHESEHTGDYSVQQSGNGLHLAAKNYNQNFYTVTFGCPLGLSTVYPTIYKDLLSTLRYSAISM